MIDILHIDHEPTEFRGVGSKATFEKRLRLHYPNLNPHTLPNVDAKANFFLKTPDDVLEADPSHPLFYLTRINNIVNPTNCDRITRILVLLEDRGVDFIGRRQETDRSGSNRSSTSALHYGLWSHYQRHPYITKASRPKDLETERLINELLDILNTVFSKKINNFLKLHEPEMYTRRQM